MKIRILQYLSFLRESVLGKLVKEQSLKLLFRVVKELQWLHKEAVHRFQLDSKLPPEVEKHRLQDPERYDQSV